MGAQKRILFLGGSFYQLAPLIYARDQGHYIITCDYLPGNPGHQYADEYYNISTTDHDAVLKLAQRLRIDGIVAYASDPSAPTAAYVAGKLHLPGNPFESVLLLTRKDLFRNFLQKHRFNVPLSASFTALSDAEKYFDSIKKTVMVKPVDSSGSKGVSKVTEVQKLAAAFKNALLFSRVGKVIIEEYVARKDYQIAGDGFVVNGKLVFRCFAQEHFNRKGNQFVPVGESFPLLLPEAIQTKIHDEIQRLLSLLQINTGALNFDILLDSNDNIYLMEIGPRSGGNLISEVIRYSTGIDLAKYTVDAALGLNCSELTMYKQAAYYSSYMLHTAEEGIFQAAEFDDSVQKKIVKELIFVKKGTLIKPFEGSNHALGCIILKFNSGDEMLENMETMTEKVRIKISKNTLFPI